MSIDLIQITMVLPVKAGQLKHHQKNPMTVQVLAAAEVAQLENVM